jgi:hypothetical protein
MNDRGGAGSQRQRCAAGTPAITASTCWPQPRQVVLPHREQGAAEHIVGTPEWLVVGDVAATSIATACYLYTPRGI